MNTSEQNGIISLNSDPKEMPLKYDFFNIFIFSCFQIGRKNRCQEKFNFNCKSQGRNEGC